MFRRLYILAFVTILSLCTRAQSQLQFVHDSLSYNNVSIDSSSQKLLVSDTLRNAGGAPFTGTIQLSGKVNGGPAFFFDSVNVGTLDTLVGNNERQVNFNIPVGNGAAGFVSGPNGVVIWPIYQQQPFTDSLHISIYVIRSLGIDEAPLAQMYLIQNGGNLNIQFGEAKNIVKQVSFYDLSGRLIHSGSEDQSHHIPTAGWSTGIYLCEIQTINGGRRTLKFILQ